MDGLYGWLRSITCYILLMSVLDNLLPGKKYGKYLRLFAGMVLILLVLSPLTSSLRLEDKIAHYYETFLFQDQAKDLERELLGVESKRLSAMIRQYEEAVAQDVALMAEEAGLMAVSCRVQIEENQELDTFGTVTFVALTACLSDEGTETPGKASAPKEEEMVEPVTPVAPVQVGKESASSYDRDTRENMQEAAGRIRRKIASYYDLGEAYVEIQIVEREG